ncbi:MAG: hypothetical protein OXH39_24475 [Candidatus Poribacteria bacterium]|nr:hypothetical protein [Candidatus Poribacteria bacterium]
MKLFTFSLLIIAVVFTLGCAENRLDVVLNQLDRPTYEVVDDAAFCYDHLEQDIEFYYLALDKLCVDLLITGKTLDELAVDTTVTDILADTESYHGEYVELEAFVIFKNDAGIVIADVNNDLTNNTLVIIESGTEYIDSLTRGSKYKFLIQVIIADTVNGGQLLSEPVAIEDE